MVDSIFENTLPKIDTRSDRITVDEKLNNTRFNIKFSSNNKKINREIPQILKKFVNFLI